MPLPPKPTVAFAQAQASMEQTGKKKKKKRRRKKKKKTHLPYQAPMGTRSKVSPTPSR